MVRRHGGRTAIALALAAILAVGLIGGCESKANAEAKSHVAASMTAMRDVSSKLTTLKTTLSDFASAAPKLKGATFTKRRDAVGAAADAVSTAVEQARTEAKAAQAVSGVSDENLGKAADLLLRSADSIDDVLGLTRKALKGTFESSSKFTGFTARGTMAVALTQEALIDQSATYATQLVDRLTKILNL